MMFGAVGGTGGKWQAVVYKPQLDYFRAADTTDPLGPNVDAYYPRVNWGGPNNTQTQTRYLQNAAYCRLKNVTIGYTFPRRLPARLISTAHASSCRVKTSPPSPTSPIWVIPS